MLVVAAVGFQKRGHSLNVPNPRHRRAPENRRSESDRSIIRVQICRWDEIFVRAGFDANHDTDGHLTHGAQIHNDTPPQTSPATAVAWAAAKFVES